MGPTSKHTHVDQRGDRSLAKHHLGLDIVDCRFRDWLYTCWSTIGHIRPPMVLHYSFNSWAHWQYYWRQCSKHQHADRYERTHVQYQYYSWTSTNYIL